MRRGLRGWAAVVCALLPVPGWAQDEPAGLPSGEGTLRGRIVRADDGELAGLPVVVYALPEAGSAGLGRGVTDDLGRFSFPGVSTEPSTVYLVGVHANDLPFGKRVQFAVGQRELEVELEVAAASHEAADAVVEALSLRFDRGCNGLRVSEVHQLRNAGERVIVIPPEMRGDQPALFELELPAGAGPLAIPFSTSGQGLVQEGRRVAFFGPLYPGTQQIEFAYSLPAEPGPLSFERRLARGAERVEVLTHARGPVPRRAGSGTDGAHGDLGRAGPSRLVEGRHYGMRVLEDLAPGAVLAFALEVPPTPIAPVEITSAQLWFELDDAALVVNEQYGLETGGERPLESTSEAPLLCLSLPGGAEALRFSTSTLAMGLSPDPSGALAVHGPIPPGPSAVALRYRLPVGGPSIEFEQRYPRAFPLLSVFVADTGILAEADRLHRRRPVRSEDRTYLHLEAFQIEPGEPVTIRFQRLAPRLGPPRLAVAGIALLAALGAFGYLSAPLRRREEVLAGDAERERMAAERESLVASIRDLDEDFETGKLTAEDHAQMRAELRARAVALLQLEREAPPAADGGEHAAPDCRACGARLAPDARFCHRCGRALAAPDDG